MIHLDIRTLVIASAISALVMAFALYVAARSLVDPIPGMRRWAWGCGVQSVGWALLATQGYLPDGVSMVVANTLIIQSIALSYQALCEFDAQRYRPRLAVLCVAMTCVLAAYFTYGWPNLAARTVVVCLGNTFLFFLCGLTILWQRASGVSGSAWWTGGGFVLCGIGGLVRVAAVISAPPTGSLFDQPSFVQAVASTAMFMGVVALPFGFLLMCTERCHGDLRRLASEDRLTGSLNRGSIDRHIDAEWHIAARTQAPLAVILLDVDNFKQINDTFGHPLGDLVLQRVADLIRRQLRAGDSVGRYGGEEFIVVLPDTSLARATQVAERIRAEIESDQLIHADITIRCTLSGGVAELLAHDPTPFAVVQRADTALYAAKHQGRNRIISTAAAAGPARGSG